MKRILDAARKALTKRAGTVIYRPVVNADSWAEWTKSIGLPEALPADQLRVTVLSAVGDVTAIGDPTPLMTLSTSGVFVKGAGGELIFVWYDWGYSDRRWTLQDLAGAQVAYTSTAQLVLSAQAGDFELTDEMLATAPRALVLGGEQTDVLTDATLVLTKSASGAVSLPEAKRAAATAVLADLMADDGHDPRHLAVVAELSKGRSVSAGDVGDLPYWLLASVGITKSRPSHPEPITPPAAPPVTVEKAKGFVMAAPERQIAYGWATIATKAGEQVVDFHGDTMSTDAMHDLAHLIVKGQRGGDFEHDRNCVNEIVEVMVFDAELQKALGIDLGHEGVLIGTYIGDSENWAKAKDGQWEQSIDVVARVTER